VIDIALLFTATMMGGLLALLFAEDKNE